MNIKLIVAILAIGAMPVCAQAQAPNPSKPAKAAPAAPVTTPAAAQKVVKTISGDKAKTQTYCDIGKLGSQIEAPNRNKI
jgi:ABC-type Zn uptake system ZnuABC Zn-binding protein ZnuA